MSFPAYPSHKDSGVEWLGEVPDHWSLPKIKHVATFAGGSTPSRDNPSFWNGSIPWVSPKDMKSETISGSEERITEDGLSQMAGGLIEPGAVLLVVRSGILRHTVPVAVTNAPVALNQDMKALRFNTAQCQAKFFFRWVQGLNDSLILAWMKQGATVESLEHQFLAETVLPLPPIVEQAAIVTFLDRETAKIDALIEEQRRLITLLKEKRQAVISHAVIKGRDPHAPLKDSGIDWLGEVPAHWDIVPLKFLASVQTGLAKGKDHGDTPTVRLPYLRVANVQNGHLNLEDVAEIDVLPSDVDRYRLRIGDVLMNEGGDFDKLGRGDVWHGQIAECLHQNHVFAVRPVKISSSWLNLINGSDYAQKFFILRSKQTTNLASISSSNLMELPVVIPPPDEQSIIGKMVSAERSKLDDLTSAAECAVNLLIERRSALISAAVTGKIDVRQSATVIPFPIDRARARRLVSAEILGRLARQATFGRTKLQKVVYLAEAHADITELAGCYIRMPYGPLDQPMMDEIEAMGKTAGFEIDDKRDRSMVRYRVTGNRGGHTEELRQWLGEQRFAKLDHLIKSLSDLKTHSAEAIATLYAVWNDALIDGKVLTDSEIIAAFFEWHPEKGRNFRADELPTWLEWMRRKDIVPAGVGSKTQRQIGPLL